MGLESCLWRDAHPGTTYVKEVCETAIGVSSTESLIATAHLVRPINRNDTGKEHIPNCETDLPPTERQHLRQKPPSARLSRKLMPDLFDKIGIGFGVPQKMSCGWTQNSGVRDRIGKMPKFVLDSRRLKEQWLYREILIGFSW